MNRPFPRFEVLGLTAALALVGACTPNTSVKPGAPELIELSIVENGGASITTVKPETELCPGPTTEGGPCDAVRYAVCESVTTNNLCRCIPNPAPPPPPPPADAGASDAATSDAATTSDAAAADAATSDAGKPDGGAASPDSGAQSDASPDAAPAVPTGTWSCTFAATSSVLYVFDRVLDTEFLGDGGGAPGLATISSDPTTPTTVTLNGDYASNGSPDSIIFPLLGAFRADGPSLLFTAAPALPAGAAVTVALDKTKVLAKDGRTHFTGTNLLFDGTITFATQPFTASEIVTPAPPAAAPDAGADAAAPNPLPDMTPATVTFTNIVDPATLAAHITVTAGPTMTIPVDVASMDGLNVTIAPKMGASWPASSTITITIDATATDAVGDVLAAPVAPASFTTSAM
jgi:hypothetical protein